MSRNNHIDDYTKFRTDKKLLPIVFRLVGVNKVVNPFLQARFEQYRQRQQAGGRSGQSDACLHTMWSLICVLIALQLKTCVSGLRFMALACPT
jgi:hypothetical protein